MIKVPDVFQNTSIMLYILYMTDLKGTLILTEGVAFKINFTFM